tara:strand:- start:84 stop:575 length:492 start_codon:yes stop_codon:yes gene_type:complete
VVVTYRKLKSIEFPIFLLPHEDWSFCDGLMFMDGKVVDDRNQQDDSLGKRRLFTPHPLFPLTRSVDSMQGLLKQDVKTFIDNSGRPFIYEKVKRCTLRYYKIKKKELRDTYTLLWLEGVSTPFSVVRPPEADILFAGVLLLHGLPWILYEYSETAKKDTWRKV